MGSLPATRPPRPAHLALTCQPPAVPGPPAQAASRQRGQEVQPHGQGGRQVPPRRPGHRSPAPRLGVPQPPAVQRDGSAGGRRRGEGGPGGRVCPWGGREPAGHKWRPAAEFPFPRAQPATLAQTPVTTAAPIGRSRELLGRGQGPRLVSSICPGRPRPAEGAPAASRAARPPTRADREGKAGRAGGPASNRLHRRVAAWLGPRVLCALAWRWRGGSPPSPRWCLSAPGATCSQTHCAGPPGLGLGGRGGPGRSPPGIRGGSGASAHPQARSVRGAPGQRRAPCRGDGPGAEREAGRPGLGGRSRAPRPDGPQAGRGHTADRPCRKRAGQGAVEAPGHPPANNGVVLPGTECLLWPIGRWRDPGSGHPGYRTHPSALPAPGGHLGFLGPRGPGCTHTGDPAAHAALEPASGTTEAGRWGLLLLLGPRGGQRPQAQADPADRPAAALPQPLHQ